MGNRYRSHIFICTNERPPNDPRGSCTARGSNEVLKNFKDELKLKGIKGDVRAQKAGCLDTCEHGVCAVVYPEGFWYSKVTPGDVKQIVEDHIIGGKPVLRLKMPEKK